MCRQGCQAGTVPPPWELLLHLPQLHPAPAAHAETRTSSGRQREHGSSQERHRAWLALRDGTVQGRTQALSPSLESSWQQEQRLALG